MRLLRQHFPIRRVILIVGLVAAWCALWNRLSIANIVSGLLVAVVVSHRSVGPAGIGEAPSSPPTFFLLRAKTAFRFHVTRW